MIYSKDGGKDQKIALVSQPLIGKDLPMLW